ncbi:MAG: PEP-CTERM sorting domain-containing protein, partial [Planctomycetes bacterium]|nr:PEP-CTERM sorting domain-containing protein [Planctomycetota bacterium]
PGGGEVADYSITLTHYAHTTQVVYVGGVAVAMATIIEAAGTFDLYPDYDLEMLVAQAIPAGSGGPVPAGYPEWQWPDGYLGEKDVGQWGVVQKIRMTVDWTPIPEPATCGLLGAGIGLLAVARRRRKA